MQTEVIVLVAIVVFLGIVYAFSKKRAKKSGQKPDSSSDNSQIK